MTIIVTGGAGFIGSNFIFHMLDKYPDYRIVCLDCLTYAGNLSTLAPVMDNPNFRFVKADICDREAVNKLFEEEHPDVVVNFAAESHVDRSIEDPEIFVKTNVILIKSWRGKNCKKLGRKEEIIIERESTGRSRDNILTKHTSWIKIIDNSTFFMAMKGIST